MYSTEDKTSAYGTFWRAYYGLAQLAEGQNQDTEALQYLQLAVDLIEEERSAVTIESLAVQFLDDDAKMDVYA